MSTAACNSVTSGAPVASCTSRTCIVRDIASQVKQCLAQMIYLAKLSLKLMHHSREGKNCANQMQQWPKSGVTCDEMPLICSTDILAESLQILSSWLSLSWGRLSIGPPNRPVRPEWLSWVSACSSFSAAPVYHQVRIEQVYTFSRDSFL